MIGRLHNFAHYRLLASFAELAVDASAKHPEHLFERLLCQFVVPSLEEQTE
jgi:hypothetical protein